MKKLKKVDVLEVKKCFVISQLIRKQKFNEVFVGKFSLKPRKRFLRTTTLEDFKERLKIAKIEVSAMPEEELDKLIRDEYRKRLVAFDKSDWFLGEIKPSESGVWRRAGNLPLGWTNGSLEETAQKVGHAINIRSRNLISRAKHVVQNILKLNTHIIQNEKYLLPIVFKGNTGTRGRRRLKKQMKYDIDDGCMRSIALTISGVKSIKAYIGFPKKS